MEIIAEIVMQIIGWLFELFGELIIQLIGEAIAEIIGHSIKEPFRRTGPVRPWLAMLGYSIFGILAGAVSLWIQPELFIKAGWLRTANLILTPVISGLMMAWIGNWRRNHQWEVIRLESFAYGFCFACSMALIRYFFGK